MKRNRSLIRTLTGASYALGLPCVAFVSLVSVAACGDDEGSGGSGGSAPAEETAGQKLCKAAADAAGACGEGSCDAAIATDCSDVVTILADPLLSGAKECIDGGGQVLSCLVSAAQGLPVGAGQETFAQRFCDDCALGAPGCDQIANATTAFGDDVLDEIATTCFSGLTCAPSLPSCVQTVLVGRAIPEATAQCLVKSFFESSGETGCGAGGGGG